VKIHHINCGTMCPMLGKSMVHPSGKMVCHCLLIESDAGLILVDTGLGLAETAQRSLLPWRFTRIVRPLLDPAETAAEQVERLGFARSDVRHIVATHLDVDHAGGLPDFPHAQVHVHELEHAAMLARAGGFERQRYRPHHFAHGPQFQRYDSTRGEPWFGFEAVQLAAGLPPELLLIPLPGHSFGHCGVAVDRGSAGWLLHAGDAYFSAGELDPAGKSRFGLRMFQRMADADHRARLHNLERLRALAASAQVTMHSAHDPDELAREQGEGSQTAA